jgi:hypothetical protein
MNMRDMDSMERMETWMALETAARYGHYIDAMMDAKLHLDDTGVALDSMMMHREETMRRNLAKAASMLGLALVDKTVLAEGEVQP